MHFRHIIGHFPFLIHDSLNNYHVIPDPKLWYELVFTHIKSFLFFLNTSVIPTTQVVAEVSYLVSIHYILY